MNLPACGGKTRYIYGPSRAGSRLFFRTDQLSFTVMAFQLSGCMRLVSRGTDKA
jgi:hypothetical protein